MNQPATLVFDLDGTISDPLLGIHRSINYALVSYGFPEVSRTAVAAQIGPQLDSAFRALAPDQDTQGIMQLVAKYRERYAQVGYAENTLYAGVIDALASFSERGVCMGVCTSKRADFADKILELFGIRALFQFVDGGDVGIKKDQQLGALLGAGLVTEASTMIGDRSVDVTAARTNGLSSVGVLWGYGSEAELRSAGAGAIIEQVHELAPLFSAA